MTFSQTVFLPVTPDEAFGLVTQPERLRRWMALSARIDVRAGGDFRWTVVPGGYAAGTVTEVEPGRSISFAFGWEGDAEVPPGSSDLTITLEPADGGTSLTLVHAGLSAQREKEHAEGWTHYLGRLTTLVEDGDPGLDVWGTPEPFDQITSADASYAVLDRILTAVAPEDSARRTPCEDFDIAALTDHLHGSIVGIGTAIGAALPAPEAAPAEDAAAEVRMSQAGPRGLSPAARIAVVLQPTLEALARRGLGGTADMGFAILPVPLVANILNLELLVHAWDYATALGRELEVSDALSEYVLGLAQETITESVRANGSFAEAELVDESAHALHRLVAFTGRVPSRG